MHFKNLEINAPWKEVVEMKLWEDLTLFYAEDTAINLVCAFVLPMIPMFWLVASLVSNWRLTRKYAHDPDVGRSYQLRRIPYVLGFLCCTLISAPVLYPMLVVTYEMTVHWTVHLCLILLYLGSIGCLMRLEAMTAAAFQMAFCFPILKCVERIPALSEATTAIGVTWAICGGMVLFTWYLIHGNALAKEYLQVPSYLNLEPSKN